MGEGVRESIKKGKFVTKISFSDNVEWSSKNLWKMISADAKANKNNNKQKIWWLYLTNFYKRYLQNLKYNVKRVCILRLILFGILSILILSVKYRGWVGGGGPLNGQNLLSVAKVICRQSLKILWWQFLCSLLRTFPF